MLLQVATKIFRSNSVGGDARSSVANEACHWCRSVFLLRAVGCVGCQKGTSLVLACPCFSVSSEFRCFDTFKWNSSALLEEKMHR